MKEKEQTKKSNKLHTNNKLKKLAIIGLGYVGLPLAAAFAKKRNVIGFDISHERINELKQHVDITHEVESKKLKRLNSLIFSSESNDLSECEIFIITVPTPVDINKGPDLRPLKKASQMVSKVLKKGDIVIYESTVYPGATEEECVPILEESSGLKYNIDFFCGYSPERINPGDKTRPVEKIVKVTSGSTKQVANEIDLLYQEIIIAGTFKASSIKVAEASKVIENTQRDLNIALMNELSIIFNKLDINTEEVLNAAGTKWNFLPFKPGLVGGHCIGVDPYYLIHKSETVGYRPDLIHAARKINDGMGKHVSDQVLNLMKQNKLPCRKAKILIMGVTFKENCPDIRNSRVIDLVNNFKKVGCNVSVYDPWANKNEVVNAYQIKLIDKPKKGHYDAVIYAVAHDQFKRGKIKEAQSMIKSNGIIYDVKYLFDFDEVSGRL